MKLYIRQFNAQLGQIKQTEIEVAVRFRSAVNTVADLPTDALNGDVCLTFDTNHLYAYISDAWHNQGVFDMSDLIAERTMQELS